MLSAGHLSKGPAPALQVHFARVGSLFEGPLHSSNLPRGCVRLNGSYFRNSKLSEEEDLRGCQWLVRALGLGKLSSHESTSRNDWVAALLIRSQLRKDAHLKNSNARVCFGGKSSGASHFEFHMQPSGVTGHGWEEKM